MKNDSQSERQASRRRSLRYHSDQEKPEIPAYLKAISAAEEEEALASIKSPVKQTTNATSDSNQKKQGVITITMDRTSIISVLFGIIIVGASCFGAGFLVSQTFFHGQKVAVVAPAAVKQAPAAPAPAVEPKKDATNEDERTRLADMAQNISGGFEPPKEAAPAKGKPGEAAAPASPEAKAKAPDSGKTEKAKEDAKKEKEEVVQVPPLNQTVAKVVPEVTGDVYFTIDLAEARAEQEAKDMQAEFKRAGIDTIVREIPNPNRVEFHVQSGRYASYEDAQKALDALPKPYSLWGAVVKNEPRKGFGDARGQ